MEKIESNVEYKSLMNLKKKLNIFYENTSVENFFSIFLDIDNLLLDISKKTEKNQKINKFTRFIISAFYRNIEVLELFKDNTITIDRNIKDQIKGGYSIEEEKLLFGKTNLIIHKNGKRLTLLELLNISINSKMFESNPLNLLNEVILIFKYIFSELDNNEKLSNEKIDELGMQLYRIFLKLGNILSPSISGNHFYYEEYIFDSTNYKENENDIFTNLLTYEINILKNIFKIDEKIIEKYCSKFYFFIGEFYSKKITNKELFKELFLILVDILPEKIEIKSNIDEYKKKVTLLTNNGIITI